MTNLIPFNLERALAGDPVVTREGKQVAEIHYFKTVNSLYAVIDNLLISFYTCGNYSLNKEYPDDLFMAPKTKKLWIGVSKMQDEDADTNCHVLSYYGYSDLEVLKKNVGDNYNHFIQIEIPEE